MKKLLKNCILISVILLANVHAKAQFVNMVQDGSFEDTTVGGVSTYWGEGVLNKWHTFDNNYYVNNYEFFSSIIYGIDTSTKLPYNNYFHTYAKQGNSAIGLLLYFNPEPDYPIGTPNMRTIVQNKLNSKLIAGKTYCATSYVRASHRYGYLQTNGLQFYFDNGQIDTVYTIHKDSSGIYPQYIAQVSVPFVISDTTQWVKVQGTFVANGSETHLTMGNFRSDSATTVVVPPWITGGLAGSSRGQSILMDDVSVIPIDLKNWLQDVYVTVGDSVWVGLDKYDMPDAVWYRDKIDPFPYHVGPGFWYKPDTSVSTFIQGVDVCGVMVYDTLKIYTVPLSMEELGIKPNALRVYPNPAKDFITVEQIIGESVSIVNILGQVLQTQAVKNNKAQFSVANLPRGLYTVKSGTQVSKILVE
jgi:hypothetical protein